MKKYLLFFCLLTCLAGCVMNRLPNLDINEMDTAGTLNNDGKSPQEIIALAETAMNEADTENLQYYAPLHLAMAEKHLEKARKLNLNGGDAALICKEADFVRKVVKRAMQIKQTVLGQLDDVFAMKERLDTIKAEVHFHDEYTKQINHIKKLIHYIEKGDKEAVARKKTSYLNDMRALEIKVVKKKILTEPMEFLEKAKTLEARKLAPKTFKTAEDTLNRSTVFIETSPRDEKGVEKAGTDALRACQHVFFVTREVMAIKAMTANDYENLVLDFENKLNRITRGLGESDVRHMSLHDQSVALGNCSEMLKRKVSAQGVIPVSVSENTERHLGETALDETETGVSDEAEYTMDESVPETAGTGAQPDSDSHDYSMDEKEPVDEWDGNPETLNMEDLYLSDEERELLRVKK